MRVKLAGNHSAYHCGCAAVWTALRSEVERRGHQIVDDDSYEALLVNGEGSMHHGRPTFHAKMKLLAEALAKGHQAYLVNTVWQDNPADYDDVLRSLAGIVLRDELSRRDLLQRHGIEAPVAIDASFFAPIDGGSAQRNFAGTVATTDFYSPEFATFVRPTEGPLVKLPYIRLAEWQWPNLVATLRTAKLLVTGRHHAIFASCRARLPFIGVTGNSHKIEGLMAAAGATLPIGRQPSDIPSLIEQIDDHAAEYEKLFSWMAAQPAASILPFLESGVGL